MIRRRRTMADETRVATWEIVGAMLRYPDSALIEALPAIAAAARDAQIPSAEQVAALAEQWQDTDIGQLQRTYVERFDLGRACSLDMSWHQFGDRRQRGLVLLTLTRTYAEHGFGPAAGELPDWLPMMLEFASRVPVQVGRSLLGDWRTPVELVRRELGEMGAPEVVLFDALSATLGTVDRNMRATIERLLAEGPPGEDVGLLPFGPELAMEQELPLPAGTCSGKGNR